MRRVLRRAVVTAITMIGALCAPSVAVAAEYGEPVCAEYAWGAGFRGDRLVKAIAIGMAESSCKTRARGADPDDQGLWQVHSTQDRIARFGDLLVPENNARAAFELSGQGTNWQTHWAASNCDDAGNVKCHAHFTAQARAAAKRWAMPDLNGDAFGDIVAVDGNGELFAYHNASQVAGGQPFTGQTWRVPGSDWRGAVKTAKGDINGDGYADLVAALDDGRLVIYNNGSLVNQNGYPYAGITWSYDGDWSRIRHLAVGDVTGDRFADLVVVTETGQLVVYANGSVVNPGGRPFGGGETWRFGDWSAVRLLTVTDVNGDGFGDIVAVDANGQLFGYNNASLVAGGRPFTGETWRLTGSDWSGVIALTSADTNADLLGDLVAVAVDGALEVFQNTGGMYGGRSWRFPGNWASIRQLA